MITALLIFGLVAAAWPIACGTSTKATRRTQARDTARRERFVRRNPDQVNSADIVHMLLDAGLPGEQVRMVSGKAVTLGIAPFTMWVWLKRFDARALAIVVAADLTHAELLGHLGNGTVPDLDELLVFAAINGLPVAERTPAPAPRTRTRPARSPRLPPILGPGSWPFEDRGRGSLAA